ncbi:MAG TPA: glycoside hydrolase family 65 protein, partial [Firmicutes bacterium]|nr:glycoside hydrolase family 65 protein [Bacillota bacterium]
YTGNDHYLKNYGIDVLVAISRFWADRVHFSKPKGQYMLHGVTGPNEYENNVNNNWFTNYIAKWTLLYTLESLQRVDQRKKEALKVTEGELKKWAEIAELMYLPADKKRGIFVQHDTFLDKELLTTEALDPQDLPLNQNWSWDRILRSCFIKQADVLQGLYYFPDDFSKEELAKNFDFYEPMTVHESSLSPSIHCVLACWLGREEKAVELYNRTARLDLDNYNNDTQDGLHITSMSGSWLCIVQGFAGMRVSGDRLSFWPFCPQNWTGYTFKILFRGRLLQIGVEKEKAFVTLLKGDPLQVGLYDKTIDLKKENTPRVVVKESK